MPRRVDGEADALRPLIQTFVRRFGLLVTRQTPCGEPLSTSHAHALMVLLERCRAEEPTSQSELGERLGIDKSNVTRLCQKMERLGHVSQAIGADDARSRMIALTAKGERLAGRIEEASKAHFRDIVGRVPPAKRAALFESLSVLNAALGPADDESSDDHET